MLSNTATVNGGEISVPQYAYHDTVPNFFETHSEGNYVMPKLSTSEHISSLIAASCMGAALGRPLQHLEKFNFLFWGPQDIATADKRPLFFQTLARTNWLRSIDGRTIPYHVGNATSHLALFHGFNNWMARDSQRSVFTQGVVAGALTGLSGSAIMYPYEVLKATQEASLGTSKPLRNVPHVLATALRHKPEAMRGLYLGFAPIAIGSTAQGAVLWGGYNSTRRTASAHGNLSFFLTIHAWCYAGFFVLYPFKQAKSMVRRTNATLRTTQISYRDLISEVRKRYGITYLFRGSMSTSPLLEILPMSISIFTYDLLSRGITERNHPILKRSAGYSERPFTIAERLYQTGESWWASFASEKA